MVGAATVVTSTTVSVIVTTVGTEEPDVVALFALFNALDAGAEELELGGLPDRNVYTVLAEPVEIVEVIVVVAVVTLGVIVVVGAARAAAKVPLKARTVSSFISSV